MSTMKAFVGIIVFAGALFSMAAMARSNYCLADVCLGDSLSMHAESFDWSKEDVGRLKNPVCDLVLSDETLQRKAKGKPTIRVKVSPTPKMAGKPTGEYFTVTEVAVMIPERVRAEDIYERTEQEAKRMKMHRPKYGLVGTWQAPGVSLTGNPSTQYDEGNITLLSLKKEIDMDVFARQPGCNRAMPKF